MSYKTQVMDTAFPFIVTLFTVKTIKTNINVVRCEFMRLHFMKNCGNTAAVTAGKVIQVIHTINPMAFMIIIIYMMV